MDTHISTAWTSNGLVRIELDVETAGLLSDLLAHRVGTLGHLGTMLDDRLVKPQRRKGDPGRAEDEDQSPTAG